MIWVILLLAAQLGGGRLTGVVRDQSGAVLPGATVTVIDTARQTSRVVVATEKGVYTVPNLIPGDYAVRAEAPAFRPMTRRSRVETGATAVLDFELVVGDIGEVITISDPVPLLRMNGAGLGQVVRRETIPALPLNGRSFITLASLAPGIALPPASQLPRINGGRPRTNEYLFDGISVLQPEPGQVAYFPVVDAIQEFRIETNSPPAEFGRFNGALVNLTTRGGTNDLHGTVFEFARHEALNARNFFSPAPQRKPEFRRNQFGGVVGGPLVRDRTFFFVDYQGQQQNIGRT